MAGINMQYAYLRFKILYKALHFFVLFSPKSYLIYTSDHTSLFAEDDRIFTNYIFTGILLTLFHPYQTVDMITIDFVLHTLTGFW